MDYACPHCQQILRTDPDTGQRAPMCPRCGGGIAIGASHGAGSLRRDPTGSSDTAPRAPSLATFLHPTPPAAGADADGPPRSNRESSQVDPQRNTLSQSLPAIDPIASPDGGLDAAPTPALLDFDRDATSAPRTHAEELDAAGHDPSEGTGGAVADSIAVADTAAEDAYSTPGPAPAAAADPVQASATTRDIPATPSFTRPAGETPLPRTARWQWVALPTLALLLVLQVLLADRSRLAADAHWRPLIASLCGVFGCSLPAWHEPDAFTMLSRDVRPAQGSAGALLVQATFRNDARWSQAWPVVRLSLSDADGRVVGARAFIPSEYLDAATTKTVLAPGQSAQIMLQVREPRASVVAFSFDFD